MTIGEVIRAQRKTLGLTLEEVGSAVGVGKSTVRKWENGDIANMKRDKIALLANVLKLPPSTFISGDEIEFKAEKPIDEDNGLSKEEQLAVFHFCQVLRALLE